MPTERLECISADCDELARLFVYWPGQGEKTMCAQCKDRAQRVATVMGFELWSRTIEVSP